MRLIECIHTQSDCYNSRKAINPVGIVVHSTGANNPTVRRYAQPSSDDPKYWDLISIIGTNSYGNHWNKTGVNTAVHYFIGKVADGTVATIKTLPENIACWGVGKGSNGSYNYNPTAHIQFEVCEDNLTTCSYYDAVMCEAMDLCADICLRWGWNADVVCSHREAYKLGYASNHSDIDHWLSKMGHDMNYFRQCVQNRIDERKKPVEPEFKQETEEQYVPAVGDIVNFVGSKHYTQTNGSTGYKCNPGTAQVTSVSYGSQHPYHLIKVAGGGSTVYGWVNAEDVKKINTGHDEQSEENQDDVDGNIVSSEPDTETEREPTIDQDTEANAGDEVNTSGDDNYVEFKVGDIVNFTGTQHYSKAISYSPETCRPGEAKITSIYMTGTHPYHLVKTQGSTSTVYGWVDADYVERIEPASDSVEETKDDVCSEIPSDDFDEQNQVATDIPVVQPDITMSNNTSVCIKKLISWLFRIIKKLFSR